MLLYEGIRHYFLVSRSEVNSKQLNKVINHRTIKRDAYISSYTVDKTLLVLRQDDHMSICIKTFRS